MKILKNNLYILKLCFKAAPLCVSMKIFAEKTVLNLKKAHRENFIKTC